MARPDQPRQAVDRGAPLRQGRRRRPICASALGSRGPRTAPATPARSPALTVCAAVVAQPAGLALARRLGAASQPHRAAEELAAGGRCGCPARRGRCRCAVVPPYVSCGELPAGQGGGPGRPGRSSACLPCPPAAQRCQHSTDSLAAVAREAAAGEAGGLRGMARQEPHLAALSSRGLGSVLTALFARCKLLDRGAGPPIGRGGRVMGRFA